MRAFARYLQEFFRVTSPARLLLTTLFVALLITLNYTFGIERRLFLPGPTALSIPAFYVFYLLVLLGGWGIQLIGDDARTGRPPAGGFTPEALRRLLAVMLLAPLYFSLKMVHWDLAWVGRLGWQEPWDKFVALILQLPAKLLLLGLFVWVWERFDRGSSFGLTTRGFSFKPYLLILLLMMPLIALTSTQHDFLAVYPKLRNIAFMNGYARPVWPCRLLYEVAYGLDFLSIELFFRGWMVVCLVRWLGPRVILPMAAFYCTVHFGKPLGECISSFFGGIVLGVIAWRTRSILGGLMVHLGIAWMMEAGGWIGNGW